MSQRLNPPGLRLQTQNYSAPLSELDTVLQEFRAVLSPTEIIVLDQSANPSMQDVLSMAKEIDRHKSKLGLRGLSHRYLPLLQSVQQFSGVIDTFIQSDPKISALLWGSVKLAIHVVFNFFDYFDKVSEMFQKLGCLCPVFERHQQLFPDSAELQKSLFSLYATVIRFCTDVVSFLRQNQFKQFVKATWKPFKLRFQHIESDMQLKRQILESELRLAADAAAHKERQASALYRYEGALHRQKVAAEMEQNAKWRRKQKIIVEKDEREVLLSMLSDYNHAATYDRASAQRSADSCQWFTELDKLKDWMTDDWSSALWLHGIPGAGKTVITTSVIDHVLKTLGRSTDTGISYFMNDFSSRESLEVRTILRCLSRQLLVTLDPIPKAIVDMLETDIALLKTSQTLLYVVDRVIRLHKTVFIILDGIDEMPDGGRLELLEILDKLIGECPRRVKVFISSRRRYSTSQLAIPRDATEISLNPQLSMAAAGLVNDIRHYVQNEMEVLIRRGRLTIKAPNLKQEIEDTLVAKSDGMFLWVSFQMNEIVRHNNDEDIRKALDTLPRGLERTYDRILQRIVDERNPEVAEKVFTWLSVAIRPMTLNELSEAITIQSEDTSWNGSRLANEPRRILDDCEALVRYNPNIRDGIGTVHFTHFTILEYLWSRDLTAGHQSFNLRRETAVAYAANMCLVYLSFANFQRQITKFPKHRGQQDPSPLGLAFQAVSSVGKPWMLLCKALNLKDWIQSALSSTPTSAYLSSAVHDEEGRLILEDVCRTYSFLSYAQYAWIYHSSDAFEFQNDKGTGISTKFSRLLNSILCVPHLPWPGGGSILALTEWSLDNDLPGILFHFMDQIKRHTPYRKPEQVMSEAIKRIRFRVVNRFLGEIEGFNCWVGVVNHAVSSGYTQSLRAIMMNQPQIFTRLNCEAYVISAMSAGQLECLVELVDFVETHETWPVIRFCLSEAAKRKLSISTLAEALLNRLEKHDNQSRVTSFLNLLHTACVCDLYEPMLECLRKTKVDLDRKTDMGETALYLAATSGQVQVVQLLVEAGADVNICGGDHGSPLQAAAFHYNVAIITQLVGAGADVNRCYGNYGTAVEAAAFKGNVEVVQELIRVGADVNLQGSSFYGTALKAAASKGNAEMVRLLIAAGANVHALGGFYTTALDAAASVGSAEVVQLLIEAGADVNVHGRLGGSALQAAASNGSESTVRLLLDAGADVNYQGGHYGSALQAASINGDEATVRLLIEAGADTTVPGGHYGSALEAALSKKNDGVIRLLEEAGAIS